MQDTLWVEKYRPRTISDTILPASLKTTFQKVVDTGEVPNMLFAGTAGLGKTTVARAICEQLGADYIVINASEEGNIDTLRGKIRQFASSISLSGGYKVVILDEADYLNANSTQPALRGFIEEFSNNCRFILTCNAKNRIIPAIHSRCSVYEFNVSKKGMMQLCGQFMKRLTKILDDEGITYEPQLLAELITRHAPDWRRVINECQRHSRGGSLDLALMSKSSTDEISTLFTLLKAKDFKKLRAWVTENIDMEAPAIFRGIYDLMESRITPQSLPALVVLLGEYQYKDALVADHEINVMACFCEIAATVEFV